MKHSDKAAAAASLAKDEYLVAVKLLLFKDDELLVLKDQWGSWDIPGGRIRKDQFDISLEDILREKIDFELGEDVKYKLGNIATTLRLEREEVGRDGQKVRIFAVCYEAYYLGGDITGGEYIPHHEWIDLRTANLDDYSDGDSWILKLKDYQEAKRNK
jgi:8-oxo-dGTP pyrophosphatase MutT (NUDIX family)